MLSHHQILEYPYVEFVVFVALVREDALSHSIETVAFASLLVVADHYHLRQHSLVLE